MDRYDAALRDDATAAALAPDLVLRVGAIPTSKPLIQYLQRHGAAESIVVNVSDWADPTLLAAEMVHADPADLCARLLELVPRNARDGAWLDRWRAVNDTTRDALARCIASYDEPFEGRALAEVAAAVPEGGTLFVSSSMPVRDLDAFAAGDGRALRVLANRGANGIDGIVSTALGAVAAANECGGGPLVLAIGDLALYHDMNGLLAAKLHALDATVVVINNDGGGIFSFLPQSSEAEHFEQLFGTPHGLSFGPVAQVYGARYRGVKGVDEIGAAVAESIAAGGMGIIELRTDRDRNVALHRTAWAAVAGALRNAR